MKRALVMAVCGGLAFAGWACSGGGGGADGGTDSGSDSGLGDATMDVVDSGSGDVVTPSEGGATLTGSQAFPVHYTFMDTALPNDDCGGSDLTADGGLAATAIILAANDLSKQACGDAGSAGATGQLVEIGIATTEYAGNQTMTHTQALAPGMYTVGNQMVPDEDFCMIPTGDTAWFQVLTFDDAGVPFANWNGVSGTVTVASIDNTSVAGSFNVQLGDANGGSADGGSLSGTFSAATCGH